MHKADVNKLYDEKLNRKRDSSRRRPERKRRQPEQPEQPAPKARKRRRVKARLFERGMGLDLPFLLLVLVLLVIGMIMMFSASYPTAYYSSRINDSYYYIRRQAIYAAIGVAAMLGISFFNYNKLHKLAPIMLAVSYIALVAVLLVPSKIHRWFEIGPINIQASEITKFAIILFFAHWGSLYYDKMQSAKYSVLPGILIFGSTAALLLLEPHYSGIVIIAILTVVMLYISGMRTFYLAVGGILLVFAVLGAWATGLLTYAMTRMDGWGQALIYTTDEMWQTTWQTRNSLYAIGSGGLFGLGLGQSRQKYLYLPEPQNDFVFAVVCEELGFVGALIILLIFALLVWRGITLSLRSKDRFGKLLGIGLSSQIGIQVVLNILVITDWLPNTGISLPFFSFGGSSLIMLLAQMGLILSISRTANIEKQ
ncbi:MAG: FtsW/RodA/SpoVE family cell cycle protein [Ruminococcus sp.]|nr:FtsW/RodA/SpoVE family cell cycle protein [Ruminococcus sp.]